MLNRRVNAFYSIALSILLTVASPSAHAVAVTCEGVFSRWVAPMWHTVGDDLASTVLRARAGDAIWTDFTRDPRYHGAVHGVSPIAVTINYIETTYPQPSYVDAFVIRMPIADYVKSVDAERPPASYFTTWADLGIRGINRMMAKHIYPVAVTNETKDADGLHLPPRDFTLHDLFHAKTAHSLLTVTHAEQGSLKDRVLQVFTYDKMTANLGESDHVLFDIGYFLDNHENSVFGEFYSWYDSLLRETPADRLSLAYRQALKAHSIDIDGAMKVSVRPTSFIVQRFLNKGDLYELLPLSLRQQMTGVAGRDQALVKDFLSEALQLYVSLHRRAVARVLS